MNTDDSHHDQVTKTNQGIDALHKAATPTISHKPEEAGIRTRAGIPMPGSADAVREGASHGA
jgi:hypothetical protein